MRARPRARRRLAPACAHQRQSAPTRRPPANRNTSSNANMNAPSWPRALFATSVLVALAAQPSRLQAASAHHSQPDGLGKPLQVSRACVRACVRVSARLSVCTCVGCSSAPGVR